MLIVDEPGYAVLRLAAYPAWAVRINGQPCGSRCVPREDGLLTIAVPRGRTTIEAHYTTTPDVWTGRALSVLSGCALVAIRRRRKLS